MFIHLELQQQWGGLHQVCVWCRSTGAGLQCSHSNLSPTVDTHTHRDSLPELWACFLRILSCHQHIIKGSTASVAKWTLTDSTQSIVASSGWREWCSHWLHHSVNHLWTPPPLHALFHLLEAWFLQANSPSHWWRWGWRWAWEWGWGHAAVGWGGSHDWITPRFTWSLMKAGRMNIL